MRARTRPRALVGTRTTRSPTRTSDPDGEKSWRSSRTMSAGSAWPTTAIVSIAAWAGETRRRRRVKVVSSTAASGGAAAGGSGRRLRSSSVARVMFAPRRRARARAWAGRSRGSWITIQTVSEHPVANRARVVQRAGGRRWARTMIRWSVPSARSQVSASDQRSGSGASATAWNDFPSANRMSSASAEMVRIPGRVWQTTQPRSRLCNADRVRRSSPESSSSTTIQTRRLRGELARPTLSLPSPPGG